MRFRETQVVEAVRDFMVSAGLAVESEFPLLGRVADVFAVDSKTERTLAVECKERDWRRALSQARTLQAAANEVFIAVPRSVVTSNLTQEAATLGIGVLAVGSAVDVEIVVKASTAPHYMASLQQRSIGHFVARRSLGG